MGGIAALDQIEKAVFVRALVKMIHSLQQAGRVPLARMCTSCTCFGPNAHAGRPRPHHCAYVDAPLGDVELRIDCAEHEAVAASARPVLFDLFVSGRPLEGAFPSAASAGESSLRRSRT